MSVVTNFGTNLSHVTPPKFTNKFYNIFDTLSEIFPIYIFLFLDFCIKTPEDDQFLIETCST